MGCVCLCVGNTHTQIVGVWHIQTVGSMDEVVAPRQEDEGMGRYGEDDGRMGDVDAPERRGSGAGSIGGASVGGSVGGYGDGAGGDRYGDSRGADGEDVDASSGKGRGIDERDGIDEGGIGGNEKLIGSVDESLKPGPFGANSSSYTHRGGGGLDDEELVTERMEIGNDDASFLLGTGGRTKKKLSRVSECELRITHRGDATILELCGVPVAVERARTYAGFVMQQRIGPVVLPSDADQREDMVILDIPTECIGYVTGHKGQGLRAVEEDFATLMFFTDVDQTVAREERERKRLRERERMREGKGERDEARGEDKDDDLDRERESEKLVIFSPSQKARQGAVLKIMSAIEQKKPGHFTAHLETTINDEDEQFDVDVVPIKEEDYSYALGKGGATRRKLARASGALIEYIGRFAFIGGLRAQRLRGRDYLTWLCGQRGQNFNASLGAFTGGTGFNAVSAPSTTGATFKSETEDLRDEDATRSREDRADTDNALDANENDPARNKTAGGIVGASEANFNPYPSERDDLTTMQVPNECVAYVTGQKGRGLRSIEEVTGTFMFLFGTR